MSRPHSESGGSALDASDQRRKALTYDDLPNEIKGVIKDYVAFTNASLRAAVAEYFSDDEGRTGSDPPVMDRPRRRDVERRHGKMNTWDVGRVTNMSRLFYERSDFNEARAGVRRRRDTFSTRVEECRLGGVSIPHRRCREPRASSTRVEVRLS